jgi:hypothetical protein
MKPVLTVFCCLAFSAIAVGNNVIFVTSTQWNAANFGAQSGADFRCQNLALDANLPGTYKAWLSTTNLPAASHLVHSTSPYTLVDGTLIARNWDDLVDGTIANPISKTEMNTFLAPVEVWTGTSGIGTSTGFNCNGWLSSSGSSATIGRNDFLTLSGWTQDGTGFCSVLRYLYCIQQVSTVARISGRVLSASGRPVTHARITVSDGSPVAPIIYYTDRGGNYSTDGLASASYTVTVSQRRFTFTPSSRTITLSGSNVTNANFTGTP